MRAPAIAIVLGLCALPASGGAPAPHILHTLTPIDSVPTKDEVTGVLGPNGLTELSRFALDETYDFGLRLRAVRAMPHYCAEQPAACRAAILAVFDDIAASTDLSGPKILRLRAALESLGAAHTRNPADVTLMLGYLDNQSRDLRFAAARALRDQCDAAALEPLHAKYMVEPIAQVRLALSDAWHTISECVE